MSEKMAPGTVMVSMWGYDQTNVDFYVVTRVTASSAWLAKIGKRIVDSPAWATDSVVPDPAKVPVGKVFRRKIQRWGDGEYVSLTSFSSASVYEGGPVTQTSYA